MASLLDLRSLSKPQRFNGQEQKWRDWRFSFEAYCGLLADDFQVTMEQSAAHPTPVSMTALPTRKQEFSKTLFFLLVQLLEGRALAILKMIKDQNGMEAWRQLVKFYEPTAPLRVCLLYTSPSPRDLSTSRMPSSA